jgi:hypothetical protein
MATYIFMDESGDLGFNTKKKSSRFFVVTFMFAQHKRSIEKVIRKISRMLRGKYKKGFSGVLHACKEKPQTCIRLLRQLSQKDISIVCILLDKKKVYTRLHQKKHVLYNYITNILLDRVFTKKLIPLDKKIHLIASRRETNKVLNTNFKNYLKQQVSNNHLFSIEIEIRTPSQEKCLQAVDFACWSIFRKYEHQDNSYYNYIQEKIVEEKPLFF